MIRTRVIKIGNSQGIRIPKVLLEQSGLDAEVEIGVQGEELIIRKASQLRKGWDHAFATMAERQDDALLDNVSATAWEQAEWEW
jgi:antitoxin MazE